MKLKYDLHMHSCLSLCAEDNMTPNNIVNMAALAGYDVIAISDHQSAKNSPAAMKAGEKAGIIVIPAMELCTSEEVHVLCLFKKIDTALSFTEYVRARMFPVPKRRSMIWRQSIMDEYDNVIGEEDVYLGGACSIGIYDVQKLIYSYEGIAIPAHIDRPSHSLLSNLGIYDEYMGFDLFEISRFGRADEILKKHPELCGKRFITDSDAHELMNIPDALHTIDAVDRSIDGVINALKTYNLIAD